jgi:NRAMP (natural resistance-associated macrophage protein)-like metal ion transporter
MSAKGRKGRRNTPEPSGESASSESHNNQHGNADEIEPGMAVEAREGDLGESDVSTARVKDVERNAAGDVTNVIVEKGVVFRKTLEVPAERIEAVEDANGNGNGNGNSNAAEPLATPDDSEENDQASETDEGKVILNTTQQEIRNLSATGSETLDSQQPRDANGDRHGRPKKGKPGDPATNGGAAPKSVEPGDYMRTLGPGVLSGMAGNDSSAVTSYSVNGATNGYGQLWLILLATPLYQAVQYACAKIGRVTQMGLADILRKHYGRKVAVPASLILVVANTALIAADLVAIGTGIQLLTGIAWEWFVVPVAVGLWYLIVYQSFGIIKKIFLAMSLVFVAYLITGVVSGAHWGDVLRATFIPHISLGFASISSAVALLGATVSPYTMYWQVQGEKEQKRPGTRKQQFRLAALDIAVGTIAGNLVAYAIIVCTAATLFTNHKEIQTAADAAAALAPLLGPHAEQLFAIGFIGSGMVAIPVLLASTSYGLSGLFGWSASLWKKPWQSEGFYLIMTGALAVSLIVALLRFDPIQLMFWANVLQGILSPVLVVFLLLVGNNRKIMRSYRLSPIVNIGLALTALIMSAATLLLFSGLLSGGGA